MKLFNFNGGNKPTPTTNKEIVTDKQGTFKFTTPFLSIGEGNLSMPYVSGQYTGNYGFVRFGADNLYPNILRQLRFTSPLVGNIIDFTANATVGGGYSTTITNESGANRVSFYEFENKFKLKKNIKNLAIDSLSFGVMNILITNDANGKAIRFKRIPMDEIRWSENQKVFWVCKDWSKQINILEYNEYQEQKPNHSGIHVVRLDEEDTIYSYPIYISSNNWAFLDGESSYLHKSNIQNSIFPSVIFKFPKQPQSDEEKQVYIDTISSAKGSSQAGKAIAFFENGIEQLPEIETIATSQNDKLFTQTDERIDAKICQAFAIDPILMGIRVSGKLGSGSDIKQAYTIYEKNKIKPLRDTLESLINYLMRLYGVKGEIKINNYQIINDEIQAVDDETTEFVKKFNALPQLIQAKILDNMSSDQILKLVGLTNVNNNNIIK